MKVIHYLLIFLVAVVLSSLVRAQTNETERPVVLSAVVPVYPAIAESARVTGDVTVGVEIDAKGKVKEARADGKIGICSLRSRRKPPVVGNLLHPRLDRASGKSNLYFPSV